MRSLLTGLALVAACASTDDRRIIEQLQAHAKEHRRPDLDARILDPAPYRVEGEPKRVTIPLMAGKAPIVKVKINGVELDCIIDTGTTHVVISATAARECGLYLPDAPPIALVTPGYEARFRAGAPDSIEIGGMKLSGGIAIVPESRSGLSRRLGVTTDLHATIGTAVLSNFNVIFDFGRRELELLPHGQEPFAGVMWTVVKANGRGKLMLIDSGANGLFLEPEFAHELGLISEKEAERLRTKADRAQATLFGSVIVDELTLGPKTFENIRAHVVEVMEHPDRGGLLGIAGLGPHRWMVDYENKRLLLLELR
ncbi:MAG: aspartyl protease family protein [Planctomycetota bacterium]